VSDKRSGDVNVGISTVEQVLDCGRGKIGKIAGRENARHEITGPENAVHKSARFVKVGVDPALTAHGTMKKQAPTTT